MDFTEKTIDSQSIFEGRIIKVRLDTVLLPNGKQSTREIVGHASAVAVVALDEEDKMIMVRQYRKPVEQMVLEIPAGIMEKGEEPLESACRELEEETGYKADHWEELGSFFTGPGFTDERIYLFLATGLHGGTTNPDEDEFLDLCRFPLSELEGMLKRGEIIDAKTIIGLQWALLKRQEISR